MLPGFTPMLRLPGVVPLAVVLSHEVAVEAV
jgi:hypothetical protein